MFTSLSGAVKPHHVLNPDGTLALGHAHLGMLAAARWLERHVVPTLLEALHSNPGYSLRVVGHSMGGGTAALLTSILRSGAHAATPELEVARCYALACPSCMTQARARSCTPRGAGCRHACAARSLTLAPRPPPAVACRRLPPWFVFGCALSSLAQASLLRPLSQRPPPSLPQTQELAAACRPFVTAVMHGTDIIPTFSPAAVRPAPCSR